MTNKQYKNMISWAETNLVDRGTDDSLSVARKTLGTFGLSLPEGDISEVTDKLTNEEFMGWKKCTYEEARAFANDGIPTIAINSDSIAVVGPEEDAAAVQNVSEADAVSTFEATAAADTAQETSDTVYFATQYNTNVTSASPCTLTFLGWPESGRIVVGNTISMFTFIGDLMQTVKVDWTYDSDMVCLWEDFISHSYRTHIRALKEGVTTITATYGSQTCRLSLRITSQMQIYLSPANHEKLYVKLDGTNYPVSEWNEKKVMGHIADLLCDYLSDYCVRVKVTNVHNSDGQFTGRPEDAEEWIDDKTNALYLALHSNGRAHPEDDYATGSVCYYNGLRRSSSLALALVDAIDPLLPTVSDRSSRTIGDSNLREINQTKAKDITAVLLETAYHDTPLEADFLINNQELIARTIGRTLVEFYGLPMK